MSQGFGIEKSSTKGKSPAREKSPTKMSEKSFYATEPHEDLYFKNPEKYVQLQKATIAC